MYTSDLRRSPLCTSAAGGSAGVEVEAAVAPVVEGAGQAVAADLADDVGRLACHVGVDLRLRAVGVDVGGDASAGQHVVPGLVDGAGRRRVRLLAGESAGPDNRRTRAGVSRTVRVAVRCQSHLERAVTGSVVVDGEPGATAVRVDRTQRPSDRERGDAGNDR